MTANKKELSKFALIYANDLTILTQFTHLIILEPLAKWNCFDGSEFVRHFALELGCALVDIGLFESEYFYEKKAMEWWLKQYHAGRLISFIIRFEPWIAKKLSKVTQSSRVVDDWGRQMEEGNYIGVVRQ